MRLMLLLLAGFAQAAAPRARVVVPHAVPIVTPVPVLTPGALTVPTLTPTISPLIAPTLAPVPVLQPAVALQQAIAPEVTPAPEVQLGNFFDGAGKVSVAPVDAGAGSGLTAPSQGAVGKALLLQLRAQTGKGYKQHEYEETSDQLFSVVDQVERNGVKGVVDAYSGVFIPGRGKDGDDYPEHGDENHDGHHDRMMNVEHIWPQSFFDKRLPFRSDLHHLMTTFEFPNGIRGHLPFGEVRGNGDYSNDAGAKRGNGVFEPPDFSKGKVARAMLYFYTRYGDRNIYNGAYQDKQFWNDNLEMFLRWNRLHPPDQDEKNRNDLAEAWQGNRNPYIDDYTLADKVGVEGFRRDSKAVRMRMKNPAFENVHDDDIQRVRREHKKKHQRRNKRRR